MMQAQPTGVFIGRPCYVTHVDKQAGEHEQMGLGQNAWELSQGCKVRCVPTLLDLWGWVERLEQSDVAKRNQPIE